jgi:hypothetical protein
MKTIKQYPTQEYLQSVFNYENGALHWKIKPRGWGKKELRAGESGTRGYRNIGILGQSYREHRLIWIFHNGDICQHLIVDHINKDTRDNRIENLRTITQSQNLYNSDRKGFYIDERLKKNKYIGQISVNGKHITKGFDEEWKAVAWAKEYREKMSEIPIDNTIDCSIIE